MAARTLMVQGTASHVGKSVFAAALCRLFRRRGYRVAPFKAQNMSNNSYVTPDGKEIGRAQAVQAAACGVPPRADFNPILIKPAGDTTAQLVVDGEVAGTLSANDFGMIRRRCWPHVEQAFNRLAEEFDVIVLEGAGSPAEVNLRDCDVVNMHMAKHAKAPVLLVGDIDRGGVLASLVGTWTLLDREDRRHLRAFAVNKFRGAAGLLESGLARVTRETGMPCAGVVPHWREMEIPDEDSLGWDGWHRRVAVRPDRVVVGIVDVPAISNFTDFEPLACEPDVELVRLQKATDQKLDALIFPGSKQTVAALRFVRDRGFDQLACRVRAEGGAVVGICSGFQLLGLVIRDPDHLESAHDEVSGLGLLPVETTFASPKIVQRVTGQHVESGATLAGYHVRMGRTVAVSDIQVFMELCSHNSLSQKIDGVSGCNGMVFGTYLHGLFDQSTFRRWWLNRLRASKGWDGLRETESVSLELRLDRLADFIGSHLKMPLIERILEEGL